MYIILQCTSNFIAIVYKENWRQADVFWYHSFYLLYAPWETIALYAYYLIVVLLGVVIIIKSYPASWMDWIIRIRMTFIWIYSVIISFKCIILLSDYTPPTFPVLKDALQGRDKFLEQSWAYLNQFLQLMDEIANMSSGSLTWTYYISFITILFCSEST